MCSKEIKIITYCNTIENIFYVVKVKGKLQLKNEGIEQKGEE